MRILALLCLTGFLAILGGASSQPDFPLHRIAHAGGAVNGSSYLNSVEAMEQSAKRGFRYFELDLSFTEDNKVVCLRNWGDDFVAAFDRPSHGRLSFEQFSRLNSSIEEPINQRCDQYSLFRWLQRYPEMRVITDFKERNLQGLVSLLKNFPAQNSLVPQVYSWEDYGVVKSLGYKNVIWTLYRSELSDDEVVERVFRHCSCLAIAMAKDRAASGLAKRLRQIGVPVYVHTVNDAEELASLKALGVAEVYSDSLYPDVYR